MHSNNFLYITKRNIYHQMSALIWSVESAILSMWAVVLSLLFANTFHVFIAGSHALITAINLVSQIIISARDLSFSHAASEAYICSVSALFAVYITALVDYKNNKYFSMTDAGFLIPLDACIGLAWFCAAFVSAFGMALSGRKKTFLMFHHYGYHVTVTMPSLLIVWLYNYDGRNTDYYVKWVLGKSLSHFLLFFIYACVWGSFIGFQLLSQIIKLQTLVRWEEMTFISGGRYFLSVIFKFLGRLGCVLIPLSAVIASSTVEHVIISWTLTSIAVANAIDWIDTLNGFFSSANNSELGQAEESSGNLRTQQQPMLIEIPDPAAIRWREKMV